MVFVRPTISIVPSRPPNPGVTDMTARNMAKPILPSDLKNSTAAPSPAQVQGSANPADPVAPVAPPSLMQLQIHAMISAKMNAVSDTAASTQTDETASGTPQAFDQTTRQIA